MTADRLPPAPHPTPHSRRTFLTLAALTAGAPVLGACRGGVGGGGASAGSSGGASASAGGSGGGAPSDPLTWQDLDGHVMGHHVTARVSPLVRVDDQTMLLVVELTRAADDAAVTDVRDTGSSSSSAQENEIGLTYYLGDFPSRAGASFTHLIDPDGMRVLRPFSASGKLLEVGPGEMVASDLVFSSTGLDQLDHVTVYVPQTGFTVVGVIDRADANSAGIDPQTLEDLDQVLAERRASAAPSPSADDTGAQGPAAGPVPIERYTRTLNGSASTHTTDKDVTVTLASDVTFDPDSYNLSDKADSQLQTVADQIAQYPDGGSLDIVGHTDDVADDAHNQKLSEDRAGAVKDRLGQLADLAKWKVSTTGKGESEPAVKDTTDEARAANRRVVITITPTGGAASSTAPSATPSSAPSAAPSSSAPGGTALPEPQGQVGKGPDGVTAVYPSIGSFDSSEQVTITLPQVVRAGGLLFGRLSVTVGPRGADDNSVLSAWFDDDEFLLSNARGEDGSLVATIGAVNGLTLLAGGERVFPADYLDGDRQVHLPLSECKLFKSLKEGAVTTVCAVWPDTGEETVTLDHQAYKDDPWHAFRLTDIPVVSA